MAILADTKKVDAIIISELNQIRDQFGDARRTQITDQDLIFDVEDCLILAFSYRLKPCCEQSSNFLTGTE